jgi:putative transposase
MPMRMSRFTEEQIAHALRQAETGTPVTEMCRAMGISEQTYRKAVVRHDDLPLEEEVRRG